MKIKIYHRTHILFAAEILKAQLEKLGHVAELVGWCDPHDETLYIIYCAFCVEQLPPNYILYQTEVPGSKWWNETYYKTLNGAKAIWDYSVENMKSYPMRGKTSLVTPGVISDYKYIPGIRGSKIIFYGALNDRRRALLEQFKADYELRIVENDYANSIRTILTDTKIVLNFHYYPNAPLEVFRINEALSFGCHVISEPGPGMERYRDTVYFALQPAEFRACIDKAMSREFNYDLKGLDNLEEIKKAVEKLNL